MRIENVIELAVVFVSIFSCVVAVKSKKSLRMWAVWSCIYLAVTSLVLASLKISSIIVLSEDIDLHEVLLVVMLLCAFGGNVVCAMLGARR